MKFFVNIGIKDNGDLLKIFLICTMFFIKIINNLLGKKYFLLPKLNNPFKFKKKNFYLYFEKKINRFLKIKRKMIQKLVKNVATYSANSNFERVFHLYLKSLVNSFLGQT